MTDVGLGGKKNRVVDQLGVRNGRKIIEGNKLGEENLILPDYITVHFLDLRFFLRDPESGRSEDAEALLG